MAFTLRNFIYDSGFSNTRLLTCQEEIDSPITGVNVIDNPDVALWVKPGELVLTTGYFFASDPNLQRNVIMNLKAAGCSALCIKLKRFFPEAPGAIIKTAEQAGLPIIDLPLEYPFSDVTRKIHEKLNNSQLFHIQQEQTLFHALINAFHTEDSLKNCLKLLSDFFSVSLFIVDERLKCLFFYLRPEEKEYFTALDSHGIVFQTDQGIPLSPDMVNNSMIHHHTYHKNVIIIPFQDRTHFLCIPDEHCISLEFMRRAMKLLCFPEEEFTRNPIILSEYYRNFFDYLLTGDKKQEEIERICEYYGYPHCKAQLCILFSLRHEEQSCQLKQPIAFLKEVLHDNACKPTSFFIASYQRQICLFLFSDKENCCQMALQCVEDFQKKYHTAFVAGISQLIWGDREIVKAYQQAAFLLSLSGVFPTKNSFYYKNYLLFWNVKELSSDNKYRIYKDTVKPLVDYDKKYSSDLLETLLQYFDARFNASLAAKQLYVHRNTFLKRMQKISELVSFDPDDINSLLSLYYGTCIYLLEKY